MDTSKKNTINQYSGDGDMIILVDKIVAFRTDTKHGTALAEVLLPSGQWVLTDGSMDQLRSWFRKP